MFGKNYGSLASIFSGSGIGWNESTKIIGAIDEAWETYVKIDSNGRLTRFKSWPYYYDWCEILGKDKATGEQAKDFITAVNDIFNARLEKEKDIREDFGSLFEGFTDETKTMSICQPVSSGNGKKEKGKKRKYVDSIDPIVELLGTFCQNTYARLGDIACRIGYEYDVSNARKEVYAVVGNIFGLSMQEKLLVKNIEDLELFFSLPNEAKGKYARMKLFGRL